MVLRPQGKLADCHRTSRNVRLPVTTHIAPPSWRSKHGDRPMSRQSVRAETRPWRGYRTNNGSSSVWWRIQVYEPGELRTRRPAHHGETRPWADLPAPVPESFDPRIGATQCQRLKLRPRVPIRSEWTSDAWRSTGVTGIGIIATPGCRQCRGRPLSDSSLPTPQGAGAIRPTTHYSVVVRRCRPLIGWKAPTLSDRVAARVFDISFASG